MPTITAADTVDVRFPTSQQLDGSDAMNPDPDYSAAYLSLATDAGDGLVGAGFVFTIGRGNNIAAEAIQTVADELVGESRRGPARRTWAPPTGASCTTRSCAGSGRRRASCTWRSAPW